MTYYLSTEKLNIFQQESTNFDFNVFYIVRITQPCISAL